MYTHHLQQSYDRHSSGGSRSDPQGYQNRGNSNSTPNNETLRRKMNDTPPITRPPLHGSVDRRDLLYNSFTSTYHGQSSSVDSRRDPPTIAGQDPQRNRRVIFSTQLEVHEKQKSHTSSTPTIPILRSSTRAKRSNAPTPKSNAPTPKSNAPTPRSETPLKHSSRRDPTPRSGERAPRSTEKKKTITDILNELASASSSYDGPSSDPPVDRSKRPLYSPAAPKSPRDIFTKIAQRSQSGGILEKERKSGEKRKVMDPEAVTSRPRAAISRREPSSNQSWDLSDLFPDSSQSTTPVSMNNRKLSVRGDISGASRSSNLASSLKAYEPREDHWDAPHLYTDDWDHAHGRSPSNSSTESQDAYLIRKDDQIIHERTISSPDSENRNPNEMLPPSGQSYPVTSVFHTEEATKVNRSKQGVKYNDRYGYDQLDEEVLENNGTELVLLPGHTSQNERGTKQNDSSVTPRTKRQNIGSLLKRNPPASSSGSFQELPVLAMSFDESVDLNKKSTDDTHESDSVGFNGRGQQWDTIERESAGSVYDDDEFLMPRRGGNFGKKWKIVFMLVCLVAICLGIGLPVYQMMVDGDSEDDKPIESPGVNGECIDIDSETGSFSERYRDLRKVVVGAGAADAEKIDEARSPQRRALCWISEVDSRIEDITGGEIPAIIQRYTMAVLYYSLVSETDDSERSLSRTDYLSSTHECDWDVVMCGAPKTVTALLLADKVLRGPLPDEIGNLGSLSFLELSLNDLSGTIPSAIENLTLLEYFAVAFNSFSGQIPTELGLLTRLEFINMRSSQVTGMIPTELGRLGHLETLLLEGNWLSGTIPEQLGNLMKAQQMSFRKNYLTGRVSEELCELREIALVELKVDSWIECDCCTA